MRWKVIVASVLPSTKFLRSEFGTFCGAANLGCSRFSSGSGKFPLNQHNISSEHNIGFYLFQDEPAESRPQAGLPAPHLQGLDELKDRRIQEEMNSGIR
jgi:hypothetical protein